MKDKNLELRMYFFVPFNIDNIYKGIQAGHVALEYAHEYGETELFKDFVDNWKTWIILNGGTTNNTLIPNDDNTRMIRAGSLNQIKEELKLAEIRFSEFREPDLNDALTSVCFICDERVFNRKDYPDFKFYLLDKVEIKFGNTEANRLALFPEEYLIKSNPDNYDEWVELMGGEKNVFLRELIKDKKLA